MRSSHVRLGTPIIVALFVAAACTSAANPAPVVTPATIGPITVAPTKTPAVVVQDPDPTPEPIDDGWHTLAFEDGAFGLIEAATFVGTDLVGVGRGGCVPDYDDPTNCYGAAWTASGGQGWIRAPDQPGLEVGVRFPSGGPEKGIFDIAAGPAGFVAIGYDYDPPPSSCRVAPCRSGPGIWRSKDGRAWERMPVDLGPSSDRYLLPPIAAIAAGPQGYVIVGHAIDREAAGSKISGRAAAWTSPDGVDWTRAADTDEMDVGPCHQTSETAECGGMRAVVATAAGYVAVGQARTGLAFDRTRPAAWTSPDGLTWTRADAGRFKGWLSGVTSGGPGVVAVGTICQPDCTGPASGGVAATSADGTGWTSAPVPGAAGLRAVAGNGPLFALGLSSDEDYAVTELQLWRSHDGINWLREPGLPAALRSTVPRGLDIAAAPDRVIVVGWEEASVDDSFQNFAYTSPVFTP